MVSLVKKNNLGRTQVSNNNRTLKLISKSHELSQEFNIKPFILPHQKIINEETEKFRLSLPPIKTWKELLDEKNIPAPQVSYFIKGAFFDFKMYLEWYSKFLSGFLFFPYN